YAQTRVLISTDISYDICINALCLYIFTPFPYTTLFRSGIHPTREGYLYLSANTPRFWRALCEKTGLAELAADPVFSHSARQKRRSGEHTSELQSRENLVCRLLHEKKNYKRVKTIAHHKT